MILRPEASGRHGSRRPGALAGEDRGADGVHHAVAPAAARAGDDAARGHGVLHGRRQTAAGTEGRALPRQEEREVDALLVRGHSDALAHPGGPVSTRIVLLRLRCGQRKKLHWRGQERTCPCVDAVLRSRPNDGTLVRLEQQPTQSPAASTRAITLLRMGVPHRTRRSPFAGNSERIVGLRGFA